jgi:subtilase-type serine protease
MITVPRTKGLPKTMAAASLAILLSGCGGGGDGGGGSGGGSTDTGTAQIVATTPEVTLDFFISAGAALLSYVTSFDEKDAAAVRAEPEFKAQQRKVLIGNRTFDSFSYADIRAEYPLSVGLTGKGQTIAVIDDGFRLTHDELDGKTIHTFGAFKVESHGTAVAAVAAGKRDGVGMMGVAPGADLHLSSFMTSFDKIAEATRDAHAKGAVVQNNSWGFNIPVTDVQASLAANADWSVEQALASNLGGSSADMSAYLDALRTFTKDGVVVFAASNDRNATSVMVLDGLPLLAPELGAGWLVAVSAIPQFKDDRIVSAERRSSGCLQMAHTCLTANGIVYSATATDDSSYQLWSGTSFAAPQISAGVALLAEAFPGLPANDIRRRLLASAENGFFAHSGHSDFGNGVVHGYNEEFGHGFMDLRAALLPIGASGLPATNSAYGGVTPLGTTYVSGGTAMGDAVVRALTTETVAIFDSLGAGFRTPAASLYGASIARTLSPRLSRFAAENGGRPATVSAFSGDRADRGGWTLHAGEAQGVLYQLGMNATQSSLTSAPTNLAGLSHDPLAIGLQRTLDDGGAISFYGFSSARPEYREHEMDSLSKIAPLREDGFSSGAGVAFSKTFGEARIHVGASFFSERNATLGMKSVGPGASTRGLSGALDIAFEAPLPVAGTTLALSAQIGAGSGSGQGLLRETRNAVFSGLGLSFGKTSAFRSGDALKLFVRQPMRIERGTAQLVVPEGRTESGDIIWRGLPVALAPSARQLDLGVEYATPVGRASSIRLGAAFARHEGHVKGASGVSLMGAFQHTF